MPKITVDCNLAQTPKEFYEKEIKKIVKNPAAKKTVAKKTVKKKA